MRAVTHHEDPKQFMAYLKPDAWTDPEEDAHVTRTFNLWANDHYKPPLAHTTQSLLGRLEVRQEQLANVQTQMLKHLKLFCCLTTQVGYVHPGNSGHLMRTMQGRRPGGR